MPPESNRNKKIIIIGIVVLFIAVIIGFLLLRPKTPAPTDQNGTTDLFPYGTTTGGTTTDGNGEPVIDANNPPGTGEPLGNPISMASAAALRQITNYPVTNFYTSQISKIFSEPKLDEKTRQTILVPITRMLDLIRWNVKQTGVLMDAEVTTDSIIQRQKTITQIPAAEELLFGNGGTTMVYRYWNETARSIESYRGSIPPDPTLAYCTAPFTQATKAGSRGAEVVELQKYLSKKLVRTINADGSFGSGTAAALREAQKILGVMESGIMDEATMVAVNKECADIRTEFEKIKNDPVKLAGVYLANNILRATVSPDGSQLFALIPDASGVTGIAMRADGSAQRKIFSSPITEWMPQWVNATTIAMTTLASRESGGYLYYLHPTTGVFKKIIGPARGLTTLVSPDGARVFYATSTDRGFTSGVYTTADGVAKTMSPATLPAKCTWRDNDRVICGVPSAPPAGNYPDDWYQGAVGFGDAIWDMNTKTGATNLVITPEQRMDVIKPAISPGAGYLYFINKYDETLWSLKLN